MIQNITLLQKHAVKRIAGLSLSLLLSAQLVAVAQGVGINTTTPDPSAALHIQSNNSGLLLPQVNLQNISDKTTIPAPAPGLLIYNTNGSNPSLTGKGFYYNSGTKNLPNWININQFNMPYYFAAEHNGSAFQIDNYNGQLGTSAIKGVSSGSGVGVHAENTDNGFALVVNGDIRLYGGSQAPAAGKVLTSVGSNGYATWQDPKMPPAVPKVAFNARGIKVGKESIPKNTLSGISFASEDFDLGNNLGDAEDGSSLSAFTVPVKGVYHFDIQVLANVSESAGNTSISLALRKNAAGVVTIESAEVTNAKSVNSNISVDLSLNVGDIIYPTIYDGSNLDMYLPSVNVNFSHFSGHLVTPL